MTNEKFLSIFEGEIEHRYRCVLPPRSRFDDSFVHCRGRSCSAYVAESPTDPTRRYIVKRFNDAASADGRHPAGQAAALIRHLREDFAKRGDNYLLTDAYLGTDGGNPPVCYHVFPLRNGVQLESVTLIDEDFERLPTKEHLERVLRLACDFLDHLHAVHESGVIHNDIKPDNVFVFRVNATAHLQLLDFDSAKLTAELKQMNSDELRKHLENNSSGRACFGQTAAVVYDPADIRELTSLGADERPAYLRVLDVTAAAKLISYLLFGSPTVSMTDEYDELEYRYPGAAKLLRRILLKATHGPITQRYADAASLAADLRCVPHSLLAEPTSFRAINAYLHNADVLLHKGDTEDELSDASLPAYEDIDTGILPHLRSAKLQYKGTEEFSDELDEIVHTMKVMMENDARAKQQYKGAEELSPLEMLLRDKTVKETVILKGDGGGGKTTTLLHAYLKLLSNPNRWDGECVLYHSLRGEKVADVDSFLSAPHKLNLSQLPPDRKITVFLDALDESLFGESEGKSEAKSNLSKFLETLGKHGARYRYVITSRDLTCFHEEKQAESLPYQLVNVEPLTKEQIERYLLRMQGSGDPAADALLRNPVFHTPIMLTMYAKVKRDGDADNIDGPASLIEAYLRTVVRQKVGEASFSEIEFRNVLDSLAMLAATNTPNGVSLSSQYLQALKHIITVRIVARRPYDLEYHDEWVYDTITDPWIHKGDLECERARIAVDCSHRMFNDFLLSRYRLMGIRRAAKAIEIRKSIRPGLPGGEKNEKRKKLDRVISDGLHAKSADIRMEAEMVDAKEAAAMQTVFRYFQNRGSSRLIKAGILLMLPWMIYLLVVLGRALAEKTIGPVFDELREVHDPLMAAVWLPARLMDVYGARNPFSASLCILSLLGLGALISGAFFHHVRTKDTNRLYALARIAQSRNPNLAINCYDYRRGRNWDRRCGYYAENGEEHVTIPKKARLKTVERNAFVRMTHIRSVDIQPPTVKTVGRHAFEDCTALERVTLPNSVTEIGRKAFAGCSALTRIDIPESVRNIESDTFIGCTSLEHISLPRGIAISFYAFQGCTSLKHLTVPDKAELESSAFFGCTSLESVSVPPHIAGALNGYFKNSPIHTVTVRAPESDSPAPLSISSETAFTVIIEEGHTEIEELHTPNLQKLILPSTLHSFVSLASYAHVPNLTELGLPTHLITQNGERLALPAMLNHIQSHWRCIFLFPRVQTVRYPGPARDWNEVGAEAIREAFPKLTAIICADGRIDPHELS